MSNPHQPAPCLDLCARVALFIVACLGIGVGELLAFQMNADSPTQTVLDPVRPGTSVRPFWNTHARRFIYPPAFYFSPRDGAKTYRFTVRSVTDGRGVVFESDSSWAPLTPVWQELDPDSLLLLVEAVMQDASTIPIGERRFIKSPSFKGNVPLPVYTYLESGIRSLDSLYRSDRVQSWLLAGVPNPDYPLWVYPNKVMGATIRAMTALARATPDSNQAETAEAAARLVADFLLDLREDSTHAMAGWPPTHWRGVDPLNHPVYDTEHMTPYPAEGALALLDLYDLTDDQRYFDAVTLIADRYRQLQREDGTWYLILNRDTGLPGNRMNPLVPIYVIELLDRLDGQYGVSSFRDVRDRAFAWIMAGPVKSFAWEAQFEDTRPKPSLQNLAYREATLIAKLLLGDPATVQVAEDILRFVEDQFVVWEPNDPILYRNWFRAGSHWNGNDPSGGKDWILPAALEQFAFYTPLAGATATVMDVYLEAYGVTGKKIYLEKARALGVGIVTAQAYHGGGEIPTHMRRDLPELNWTNNSGYAALMLIKWANVLSDEREAE